MLLHTRKDLTNCLTFRVDLDGIAHAALQWELVSLSYRVGFLVTTMTERDERM